MGYPIGEAWDLICSKRALRDSFDCYLNDELISRHIPNGLPKEHRATVDFGEKYTPPNPSPASTAVMDARCIGNIENAMSDLLGRPSYDFARGWR